MLAADLCLGPNRTSSSAISDTAPNGKGKKERGRKKEKTSLKNTLSYNFALIPLRKGDKDYTNAKTCRWGNEVNLSAKSGEVGLLSWAVGK